MKLVYPASQQEVRAGDEAYRVTFFRPPHKPSSEGHVTVAPLTRGRGKAPMGQEYYVSVIGAEWIDREDRS